MITYMLPFICVCFIFFFNDTISWDLLPLVKFIPRCFIFWCNKMGLFSFLNLKVYFYFLLLTLLQMFPIFPIIDSLHPAPSPHAPHCQPSPQSCLCPCAMHGHICLYVLWLISFSLSHSTPVWDLWVCSMYPCLLLCQIILLVRFHIWVRSYGICLSLTGLFHSA